MNAKWQSLILIFVCGTGILFFSYLQKKKRLPVAKSEPARIVSLAPDLTEILFALGLDDKIVAVSSDSDYPPAAAKKTQVGTFWQPNIEAVISAKPDIVITLWFERQTDLADRLKQLGYNILTFRLTNLSELFETIEKIGFYTGKHQQAKQLIDGLNAQLTDITLKTAAASRPKVLWVIQTEPLRVAGRSTFINELIEVSGGDNALGSTIYSYPPISTEQLLICRPEVVIQPSMQNADLAAEQKKADIFWSKWPDLPAVKNKRIYVIQPDTVCRVGPRIGRAAETIAKILHPEIFGENPVDITIQK